MSTLTYHPSLDTDGWVDTPVKCADYLLSHFFLADYSQTAHFNDKVSSFSWLLQRYQSDPTMLRNETQQVLSHYFSKQFSDVEVQVSEISENATINESNITLFVIFTDTTGTTYNLARLIKYSDLKVNEIISVINGG